MAAIKVSVEMQKQILELSSRGVSPRKIAKTLKISRNTVRKVLRRGDVIDARTTLPEWAKLIDWEKVPI